MTTIVNIYKEAYDVYIGRKGKGQDGYFGNPHPLGYCYICKRKHDRKDSVAEFNKYFIERLKKDEEFKKRILSLKNHVLGCFCIPFECHGHVIAEYLDSGQNENPLTNKDIIV
jgi:hypothetical protein